MKTQRIKLIAIALFAVSIFLLLIFKTEPAKGAAIAVADASTEYKAKCAACHAPNASKFYDPAKTDEEHVQTILKGKKGEKPPYMPGFETKGMTDDQAKTLADHMRSLRRAS